MLECPVATLYGLIFSEQGNTDRRGIQDRLQFGGGPAQLDRPFRHLRLQLAARAAQVLLRQRALERAGGVIRGHRKQQLVDLGGKVDTIGRHGDQAALGIDANGNDDTAARRRAAADVGNDLLARAGHDGEVALQPFRKGLPGVSPRHFDCHIAPGIAQADESEFQAQRPDQHVRESGGDFGRVPSGPGRLEGGNGDKVPERRPQPDELGVGFDGHPACHAQLLRTGSRFRNSTRNWSGGTKKGFSCSSPPMITVGCVRMMSIATVERILLKS